jgi:hypothetical protein
MRIDSGTWSQHPSSRRMHVKRLYVRTLIRLTSKTVLEAPRLAIHAVAPRSCKYEVTFALPHTTLSFTVGEQCFPLLQYLARNDVLY